MSVTETAMLRVWSDILTTADNHHVTLLCLLDLAAAFDYVEHAKLLKRLQFTVGVNGVVLKWMASFQVERTFRVPYNGHLSSSRALRCGVPQVSVIL